MCGSIRPLRILVIDDDSAVRDAVRGLLASEGYEVSLAIHGRDALSRLQAGPRPDVILSDLVMPIMNGFQFIREIREHAQWRSIPVVVFSASANAEASNARAIGAFAVLRKLADVGRLFETLLSAASSQDVAPVGAAIGSTRGRA
jgi:two-component system chemotaxis response regulator CheY